MVLHFFPANGNSFLAWKIEHPNQASSEEYRFYVFELLMHFVSSGNTCSTNEDKVECRSSGFIQVPHMRLRRYLHNCMTHLFNVNYLRTRILSEHGHKSSPRLSEGTDHIIWRPLTYIRHVSDPNRKKFHHPRKCGTICSTTY